MANNGLINILISAMLNPDAQASLLAELQKTVDNLESRMGKVTITPQINGTTDATVDQFVTRTQNKITNLQSRNNKIFDDPAVQSEIQKVQLMLDNLKMNPASFSTASKAINTEMDSTRTAFNSVVGSVRQTQNATDDYFTTIGKDFIKFSTWMIVASALMLPLSALKNGLADIVSLNSSLTMTAEAMNTTVSNIQQIATGSQQIAISMGASVKDVLDIAHIYANVSESQASIMAQTKSTVELMNISGMSGSDATNALQGVTNNASFIQ